MSAAGRPRPHVRDELTIRAATRADVVRVLEIERESFSDPWTRQSFESLLGNPHVCCSVAERRPAGAAAATGPGARGGAGEVVGYVVAWLVADEAEIANVAVA